MSRRANSAVPDRGVARGRGTPTMGHMMISTLKRGAGSHSGRYGEPCQCCHTSTHQQWCVVQRAGVGAAIQKRVVLERLEPSRGNQVPGGTRARGVGTVVWGVQVGFSRARAFFQTAPRTFHPPLAQQKQPARPQRSPHISEPQCRKYMRMIWVQGHEYPSDRGQGTGPWGK